MNRSEKALQSLLNSINEMIRYKFVLLNGLPTYNINENEIVNKYFLEFKKNHILMSLYSDTLLKIYSNINTVNPETSLRNIIKAIGIQGVSNVYDNIKKAYKERKCTYYSVYTLRGIEILHRLDLNSDISIVPVSEIPLSLIERVHKKHGIEYGYSRSGILFNPTVAIIHKSETILLDNENPYTETTCDDDFVKVFETINCIALLIPLLTRQSCFLCNQYVEIDNDYYYGVNEGLATSINEFNINTIKFVELDPAELDGLIKKVIIFDNSFRNHVEFLLRRFNSVCVRQNNIDILIDLRIVLEGLLTINRNNKSRTNVIRERGSKIMAKSEMDKVYYMNFFKEAYDLSSKAVHGTYIYDTSHYAFIEEYKSVCIELIKYQIDLGKYISD